MRNLLCVAAVAAALVFGGVPAAVADDLPPAPPLPAPCRTALADLQAAQEQVRQDHATIQRLHANLSGRDETIAQLEQAAAFTRAHNLRLRDWQAKRIAWQASYIAYLKRH